MNRKKLNKHRQRTGRWQLQSFVQHVRTLPRHFIKKTVAGRRYFVVPLPSKQSLTRFGIIMVSVGLAFFVGYQLYRYFGPHDYRVSAADNLLSEPSSFLAKSLTFDEKKKCLYF